MTVRLPAWPTHLQWLLDELKPYPFSPITSSFQPDVGPPIVRRGSPMTCYGGEVNLSEKQLAEVEDICSYMRQSPLVAQFKGQTESCLIYLHQAPDGQQIPWVRVKSISSTGPTMNKVRLDFWTIKLPEGVTPVSGTFVQQL